MAIHLLTFLQAGGMSLASAVALGAIVGPSQVAARFMEMLLGRYHHPIWTKLVSVTCVAASLALLWGDFPLLPLVLVLYGAGIGLESIVRATLPLSLFDAGSYPQLMGKLARLSLIAQAVAPSIGASLIERLGSNGAIGMIVALACVNVVLALALLVAKRKADPDRQP
jgi:hypothetical protein